MIGLNELAAALFLTGLGVAALFWDLARDTRDRGERR